MIWVPIETLLVRVAAVAELTRARHLVFSNTTAIGPQAVDRYDDVLFGFRRAGALSTAMEGAFGSAA
ncbi:hypothetical protein [Haloplanus sp.]|uniref:hypothetical protein n=1 Tax=Haloplanus sp. TaxID=1961696 RepID=UPI00262C79C9|nr:hypothetical protein [Haloplanus sp.]